MGTSYQPRIVTDGLVLCLDAGDPKSYPGSGDVWYDRSGNNYDFDLIGNPTYTNNYFSFGSSKYASGPPSNTVIGENQPYITLSIWKRYNRTQSANMYSLNLKRLTTVSSLVGLGADAGRVFLLYRNRENTAHSFRYSNASNYNDNNWHNIVGVFNDSIISLYIDGVLDNEFITTGIQLTTNNTSPVTVGAATLNNTTFLGDLANPYIYNRALSPEEVLQNYNATKGRFGL